MIGTVDKRAGRLEASCAYGDLVPGFSGQMGASDGIAVDPVRANETMV